MMVMHWKALHFAASGVLHVHERLLVRRVPVRLRDGVKTTAQMLGIGNKLDSTIAEACFPGESWRRPLLNSRKKLKYDLLAPT